LYIIKKEKLNKFFISQLERELARLEELNRQNIERFIHAVRQDLISWWDRCYVSDAERRNFTPFYAEVFTEDLLELHESQVEKYKALHIANKEIFLKVTKIIFKNKFRHYFCLLFSLDTAS
jgi:protein regulator of cytokinesis 1